MVNLKTAISYGRNLLNGTKYGGVQVGNKLTLVPSERLSKFVLNAEQYGFKTDTLKKISGQDVREYARRLGSAGETSSLQTSGTNDFVYFQRGRTTQIYDPNGPMAIQIVEKLKNPTREYLKFNLKNCFKNLI